MAEADSGRQRRRRAIVVAAWLLTAVFYFYQYSMRSAPAVMVPELTHGVRPDAPSASPRSSAFSTTATRRSASSPASRWTSSGRARSSRSAPPRVAIGAILFSTGDPTLGSIGRFMQGAGGVFALIGAVYLVTTYMPASRAATMIGATQMFGMAGGSAGQFVVGPLIASGLPWDRFWLVMGVIGVPIAVLLFLLIPETRSRRRGARSRAWARRCAAMGAVFTNPQSILCGLIAGLIFIPTTIFDMVWGVRFLQEAHDLPYSVAGPALGVGAVRLDHRLSAARLAHRPDRPPQAGDHRRGSWSCSAASR